MVIISNSAIINNFFEENIKYLSRDIIFLAYDGDYMEHGQAVNAFLNSYHHDYNQDVKFLEVIRG